MKVPVNVVQLSKIAKSLVNRFSITAQELSASSLHFETYLVSVWNAKPSFIWSLGIHYTHLVLP